MNSSVNFIFFIVFFFKIFFYNDIFFKILHNLKSIGEGRANLLKYSGENRPKQKTFSIF